MLIKARDIPLAFAAITIGLLIFAFSWTAPYPQLCPKSGEQSAGEYQANTNSAGASGQVATKPSYQECDEKAVSDWWMVKIGIFTAAILSGQLLMFFWQLRAMQAGVKDAAVAADAALKTANAALSSAETARHAERAYIQMSHVGELAVSTGRITLNLQLKNWGKTPGEATDQLLGLFSIAADATIPPTPQYDQREREGTSIVLVPTGFANWEKQFFFLDPGDAIADAIALVDQGAMRLLLLGYVDYRDKFGGRHRAGYAREYIPARNGTGNNLVFITAPNYNYDRVRVSGEGSDWAD